MDDRPHKSRRRLPKGDKRGRTRAALLEAARALVIEEGYVRPTLAKIAKRAGMTTGAIYGNFRNRDELFVALGDANWTPIKPRLKPHAAFADVMRAMADAALAAIPERAPTAVTHLSRLAQALTHPDLRARMHDTTDESYAVGAEWLRAMLDERELPMTADHLVRVIHALTEGLLLQRLLTPNLVPDEVFYEAFDTLARAPRLRQPENERGSASVEGAASVQLEDRGGGAPHR